MSTIGDKNAVEVAGRKVVDPDTTSSFKILHAAADAANFSVLKDQNSTSYQVPALKKLRIVSIQIGSGAAHSVQLLYGDTAVVNSASAPTTPIYFPEGTSNSFTMLAVGATGSADRHLQWSVPASKYPHVKINTASGVAVITAFEETA